LRIPQVIAAAALAALVAVDASHAEVPAPGESSVPSPWAKYCGREPEAGKLCFTGGEGRAGQHVFAAVLIEPQDESRKRFRIVLPARLQLQSSTRLVIDSDPSINGEYVTCAPHGGCIADYDATPGLVARLKTGRTLKIHALDLTNSAITFALPLSDAAGNGFRTASEGPASTDPRVFEEQQKKLMAYAQTLPGAPMRWEASTYSPWKKFCGKGQALKGGEGCLTFKDGRDAAGQPVVAATLMELAGDPGKVFRFTLPAPLLLRHGADLRIDGQPPVRGAFFTCFGAGCMADVEATPELVTKLKSGHMLQIKAVNLAGNTVTFPLPLDDASGNSFQTANDGPAGR
jgi:invasion protein IalB